MFNYMFITNKPNIARFVEEQGVHRIFVDLEVMGKKERQGHLDTVISKHSIDDVRLIKNNIRKAKLLVRLNPFHVDSKQEVDAAIDAGADIIMLPMIRSVDCVSEMGGFINGRAKFIPLIETISSFNSIDKIQDLRCVDELHIGLNDLHLEMQLSFMFELFSMKEFEEKIKNLIKPFGIGGVANVGKGSVPGELVMAQHVRLNSSGVILSRSFHMSANTVEELESKANFIDEFTLLEKYRSNYSKMSEYDLSLLFSEFREKVSNVVKEIGCHK